jgi:hypothetical protein
MDSPASPPPPQPVEVPVVPRVAVVVVHGVGNQVAEDSVQNVAGQLLRLRRLDGGRERARYTPFTAEPLRITTAPLLFPAPGTASDHRDYFLRQLHDPAGTSTSAGCDAPNYSTLRLSGARLDAQGRPAVEVDLYELYWADLSRLATGPLGVVNLFAELYRILFHLPHLGRETLGRVPRAAGPVVGATARATSVFHYLATLALTVILPVLNLALLALLAVPAAVRLAGWRTAAGETSAIGRAVLAGTVGVALLAVAVWRSLSRPAAGEPHWSRSPAMAALLAALSGGATWWWSSTPGRLQSGLAVAVATILVGAIHLVLDVYSRSQPPLDLRRPSEPLDPDRPSTRGWLHATAAAAEATLAACIGIALWRSGVAGLMPAAVEAAQACFECLNLAWGLLLVSLTLGLAAMGLEALFSRGSAEAARRRGAQWTAVISLAVPITGFLILTIGGWLLLLSVCIEAGVVGPDIQPAVDAMMARCIPPAWAAVPLGVAVLLVIAGMVPPALAEVAVPAGDGAAAERWGRWLDRGLQCLNAAVLCLALGLVGYLAFGIVHLIRHPGTPVAGHAPAALHVVYSVLGIAAAAVLLRSAPLLAPLGGAVDIMLDVDNHLRTDPPGRNPRARIAQRYAALLRYLSRHGGPEGPQRYRGVVLVTHSQGTVITTDLLRLAVSGGDFTQLADPGLPPLRLFTMGSPLRQHYGARFPSFYGWADDPRPEHLGVRCWINAYRSADYVGRWLWRRDDDRGRYAVESSDWLTEDAPAAPPAIAESCVGPGAHLHYWDDEAPGVAGMVDRLIHAAATAPMDPTATSLRA